MTTRGSREAAKSQNELNTQILTALLLEDDNKFCSECLAKGPRWASSNLGIFFCIRCSGIHRNLGVHISKVRSVNLDTWSAEQVANMQQWGNARAALQWEFHLPEGFHRPTHSDAEMEAFIRAKYERKKYARKAGDPELPAPHHTPAAAAAPAAAAHGHGHSHHGHGHGHSTKKPEQRPPLTLDSIPTTSAPVAVAASSFEADFSAFSSAPAPASAPKDDLLGLGGLSLGGGGSSSASKPAAAAASNDLSALFGAAPPAAPVAAAAPAAPAPAKGGALDIMSLFGSAPAPSPQQQQQQQQQQQFGGFQQQGFGGYQSQPVQQQGFGGFQQQQQQQPIQGFGGFQQQQMPPQQGFGSFSSPQPAQQQQQQQQAANAFAGLGSFGSSSQNSQAGSTLLKDLWK